MKSVLDVVTKFLSFEEALEPFGSRFATLKVFCGCRATVFPGTATVESDFSILNWEYESFSQSILDVPLEGKYVDASTLVKGRPLSEHWQWVTG